METLPFQEDRTTEPQPDRHRRLAAEIEAVARARASAAAGRLVDLSRLEAWVDSLDSEHELPLPTSGR